MTYSVGGLIQAVDYNTFAQGGASVDNNVANINTIWGVGTGDKGWGQSTTITPVSASATVTATQWATLFSRFTSAASQTSTSVTAITNPVFGDTVSVKSNFSTNLSSVFTNRNNAQFVGTAITANGVATRSTAWKTNLTATHTVTFASANAMRYFFNAGGRITWTSARSGGTSNNKNTAWTNLCTECGTLNWTTGTSTQSIASSNYTGTTKTGGGGSTTTLLTGTGFYDLTTSNTEVFKQYSGSYLYTNTYITVNCSLNASPGSSTVMTITVFFDDAGDIYQDEDVDGTLTSTVTAIPPSTNFLTEASWGTPTLSSSITGS